MTRIDQQVEFDWNAATPYRSISASHFGVRWTGTIQVSVAGDYPFSFTLAHCYPCGDAEGVQLYFDNKPQTDQPVPASEYRSSGLEAFGAVGGDDEDAEREAAVDAAKQADVVVAFVGLSPDLEGEEMPVHVKGFDGGDRTSIELPAVQEKMLEAVAATGKPLVVVLLNGSALAVGWAKQHANAIVEAWYPGEEGGTAIADVLTGAVNPAGRLPITFYASTSDLPPFDDYSMSDRTYRYYRGTPLWGFGYGLSYSTFKWTNLKLSTDSLNAGDPLTAEADIENTSSRSGDAVSELYLTPPTTPTSPRLTLVGFARTTLAPRAKQHIHFTVDARDLSTVNADGSRAVEAGDYMLHLGGSQPTEGDTVNASFTIRGSKELPR